jgi:hypothetical protein
MIVQFVIHSALVKDISNQEKKAEYKGTKKIGPMAGQIDITRTYYIKILLKSLLFSLIYKTSI